MADGKRPRRLCFRLTRLCNKQPIAFEQSRRPRASFQNRVLCHFCPIERNLKDGRHLSKHPLVFLHAHFQVNDVDHRKMKSSRSVTIQRIRGGGFVFCGSSGERSIADGLARLDRGNFRFHPVGLFFFFLSDARFTEQMCDFNSPPPLPHPKMRLHSRRFRYHTFG